MSKDAGVGWLVAIVLGIAALYAAVWAATKEGELGWLDNVRYFSHIRFAMEAGWLVQAGGARPLRRA